MPVVESIVGELPAHVRLSIDTRHEAVARAAVAAGTHIINDMSASLGGVAGELGVGFVAAHMQGTPPTMQHDPRYVRVVDEVLDEMVGAATRAVDAGATTVWIDPGIGFGKTLDHNLALLHGVGRIRDALGLPVLVGTSRKSFLGRLTGDARVRRWGAPDDV